MSEATSGKTVQIKKLTPNLVVRDVQASLRFYCEVLGLETGFTVADQAPFVFGSVTNGLVEVFFQ
jgi:catechol 2,3-dioxygenase-like lactoylglutathione lyase family enzyme